MRSFETRNSHSARETRAFAFKFASGNEDGTIEGYGSVFGVRDSYDDVIVPGAFKGSLSAHAKAGTMPAMLWQHDPSEPIGVWTEMSEDASGLRIKGRLSLDTTRGREAHALMKMGAINGLSIGFVATAKSIGSDGIRKLTEIDLWEVSIVTFPANGKSRVTGVKSADMDAPKDAEKVLREAGFSKSDATAFVSRVMRMGEERRDAAQSLASANTSAMRLLATLTHKD